MGSYFFLKSARTKLIQLLVWRRQKHFDSENSYFLSTQQGIMIMVSLTSSQVLLNYMDQMEESGFNIYEV